MQHNAVQHRNIKLERTIQNSQRFRPFDYVWTGHDLDLWSFDHKI